MHENVDHVRVFVILLLLILLVCVVGSMSLSSE